jgi:outer membrane lipoprotein-sorting protein
MKKYYFLIFSLFFLSTSAQNDLENIKKKYGSIKSYSLNYELIMSMDSTDEDVKIIEESGKIFGNNSSYIINHKNMDVISDGEKIYNIIHSTKEINIVQYSDNNLWNPINIFKNFLERINSSLIEHKNDYIHVSFYIEDLERTYLFFLDKNYDIFKLVFNTKGNNSKTTILINNIEFTDKTLNIGFDKSSYEDYYLNFL